MGDRHESQGAQCPSYSLCWVLFARRSEPAPTSHSRTWRSGSSSPCSAADRSDRNSGYSIAPSGCGREFRRRVKGMCIAEVLSSPRSPWQNPFAERVIGTLRRELLDHVIVLSEGHLRRRLRSYLRYYHGSRTHLALEKDAPQPRAVEPPELGHAVALPHVGGLHPPLRPTSGVDPVDPSSLRRQNRSAISTRDGFAAGSAINVRSRSAPCTHHTTVMGRLDHRHDRRGLKRRDRVLANDS